METDADVSEPARKAGRRITAAHAVRSPSKDIDKDTSIMQSSNGLRLAALAIACSIGITLLPSQTVKGQESELEAKARELISAKTGISPDALVLENVGAGAFSLQKVTFYDYKFSDKAKGEVYSVALDGTGVEIDADSLRAREQTLYVSRYGRVDERLSATINSVDPRQLVQVVFWAERAAEVSLARPSTEQALDEKQIDQLYATLDAERASIAKKSTDALVSQLVARGLRPQADALTPSVSVELPAGEIRELSLLDGVSTVFQAETFENKLATSGNSIAAYPVHALGNTGQGVRVAQVEVGGRIDLGNPSLAGVVQDNTDSCYNNHGTNVAGAIRSTHATHRGIAPGVTLRTGGSCGGNETQLRNASNRAASWGARALNLSFGREANRNVGSFDRFYDEMVQDGWRTVVVAAGNNNPPFGSQTGNVGSPALAYNVITVGAFNDRGSPWVISNFSSWRDPNSSHGDREKPEVAAPGTNITMTSGLGLGVNSGTSFAAPMVTGVSALMMRDNGALTVWPESVKAIMMTTATSNIEGAARLSEFDGAGGVNATRATRVARRIGGNWGGQGYSCGAASNIDVTTFAVSAGKRTRAAIAWDTNTTFWNFSYGSRPSADLDMQIIAPNGSVVTGSYSWDNTYEIVDFTPPTTGNYRLRVKKYRCNHTPKWLGWAWHTL